MTTLPTTTRQTLRRDIARELGMEFYRRWESLTASSDSTASLIKNAQLTQENDYWKNAWFFNTGSSDGDVSRLITASVGSDGSATLESALTTAPVGGETFEILSRFSPVEIHGAINRAISGSFPYFFDTLIDESLVIEEDKTDYDLSTVAPWTVAAVWIENNHSRRTGDVTSADSVSVTDASANFSDVSSDWFVSIYDGKGSGQLRAVASVTGTTKLNVADWTTDPDSTSRYCVWDALEQRGEWKLITSLRFDRKENPKTMYLASNLPYYVGQRIRLRYTTVPAMLSADSDTTLVPREFIINKAMAHLSAMRINHNRADRSRYMELERDYAQKAEEIRRIQQFRPPDQMIWTDPGVSHYPPSNNPLGW